jgi:hypothetical protein
MENRQDPEPVEFVFQRQDTITCVSPPLPTWVRRELSRPRRAYRAGGSRGFRSILVEQEYWGLDGDGNQGVLTGLVPRIARMLEAAGHRVTVEDLVDRSLPARNWHLFPGADRRTAGLLRDLDREPRGQIIADSEAGARRAIALVTRFFTGKVMIICPRRRDAHRLLDGLGGSITEPIGLVTRGFGRTDARVEVGTVGSLDLRVALTLVLYGTDQAFREVTLEHLVPLETPRIYGVRVPADRHWPRRELFLEAILGPVLGESEAGSGMSVGVSVQLARWPGEDCACGGFGLEWKRRAIWHNGERNDAIARIAGALADGDESRLRGYGLFVDTPSFDKGPARRLRVVLLVESPEHGRELAARLPGWRVLTDVQAVAAGRAASAGPEERADVPDEPDSPVGTIVTVARPRRLRRLGADIVVRADGTPWPLDLPGLGDRPRRGGLAIVDMVDHCDPVAQDASRKRVAGYTGRGWAVVGGPASIRRERLERRHSSGPRTWAGWEPGPGHSESNPI